MNFLSEFNWTKGSGRDKDGNVLTENSALLVSDFVKAPCDLLIIPGDSRVEYKIDYPSDKSVVPAPGFLRNKGYVINCGFVFGLRLRRYYFDNSRIRICLIWLRISFTAPSRAAIRQMLPISLAAKPTAARITGFFDTVISVLSMI